MANSIIMKKIEKLEGFDPREVCVSPWILGFSHWVGAQEAPELVAQATELAKKVDGICIAIVKDPLGQYVLTADDRRHTRALLFNALECGRVEAEARAITYNTGRGALTVYWFDRWIRYQPGSLV